MIGLRKLPTRLAQRRPPVDEPHRAFGIDNFTLLGEDDTELVFGLAERFWQSDFGLLPLETHTGFPARDEPGIALLALNFRVASTPEGHTDLSTETRVFCTDRHAQVRFAPYWYLIRPVSGLLRRRMLNAIRKVSEMPAPA